MPFFRWSTFLYLLNLGIMVAMLISCRGNSNRERLIRRTITDGLGTRMDVSDTIRKVVGLSPAMTEILFALLHEDQILAVTPHCNYPKELVAKKPVLEVYPLDVEKILALKPDLVLSEEGITSPQDAARLRSLGIPVALFSYSRVSDILSAMERIRSWIPCRSDAGEIIFRLREGLKQQEMKYQNRSEETRPKALVITWIDPVFAYGADSWMSDKLRLSGGRNCLTKSLDKPYPVLQRETILALNPDFLFGGSFNRMDTSFFRLYPELKQIEAYRKHQVFELNDDLASRPGPRFLQGIQEIEQLLSRKLPDSSVRN